MKTLPDSKDYESVLSDLKPAATKLVLDSSTGLPELLKLTLLDLVYKEILIIKNNIYRSHPNDPQISDCLIIETGKNFVHYKPDAFEIYFTEIINTDVYFKLSVYLRKVFLSIQSEYQYKKLIIDSIESESLFSAGMFNSVFRIIKLSDIGSSYSKYFQKYFNHIDTHISDWIKNDIQKANNVITNLKGNIFLLDKAQSEIFIEITKAIQLNQQSVYTNANDNFLADGLFDLSDILYSSDSLSHDFEHITDSLNFSDDFGDCFDID